MRSEVMTGGGSAPTRVRRSVGWNPRRVVVAAMLLLAAAGAGRPAACEEVYTAILNAEPVRGGGKGQIAVTLLVRRLTPEPELLRLKKILDEGGQQALLAALRGRADGALRLGALEQPLSLVSSRETRKGRRLVVVTPRRLQIEEINARAESLDFPFGIADVELDGFGSGDGLVYLAAAISVDADGQVQVRGYRDEPGHISQVRLQR